MGFTINEKIKTELTYKEIALITVACGVYQEQFSETADKEEMYNHPDNDKPNGH